MSGCPKYTWQGGFKRYRQARRLCIAKIFASSRHTKIDAVCQRLFRTCWMVSAGYFHGTGECRLRP
jgi:hypothetical protein